MSFSNTNTNTNKKNQSDKTQSLQNKKDNF